MGSSTFSMIQSYAYQRKLVRFLTESTYWSKEKWNDYQNQAVQKLLTHSLTNVPYYKKICQSNNIKIGDDFSVETINRLPFLTRNLVRAHNHELMALNYPKKSFEIKKTSGTTEKPLAFYVEKERWLATHLAYNRVFMKRGRYKRGDKTLSLLGIKEKSRFHRILNTLELSSLYLHNSYSEYLEKIEQFNPKFIVSYPSALYFLSKYILEGNHAIKMNPQAIFFHGEPVYEWQIDSIKEVFNCEIFDIYGNGEKNVLSATCEHNYLHHVFPSYCIVELIDKNGQEVTKEGAYGEIVVTSLHSRIFPFIRYRTGDIGVFTRSSCSCGRNFQIIKRIIGRINDAIVTHDETVIPSSHINKIVATHSKGISKWQFVQNEKGILTLSLAPLNKNINMIDNIIKDIESAFDHLFPHQINIKFNIVDNINHLTSRKHSFLIQHLPVNILDSSINQ